MKKLLFIFTGVLITFVAYSQAPQAFQYQAVVRDNSGNLMIDQSIDFQIDILQGSVDGITVYSETHSASSNAYGLVNLAIGSGTTTDEFSEIDWEADSYFIKLSVNGDEMGTTQLLSVPYALHAETAETITGPLVKNLSDPVDDQDAATKAYVDRQITNPGVRIEAEVDSILCYGDASGAIDLTITGGTSPYTFEWDDGSSTEDLTAISYGKYQVYVEDSNGLTAFRHFTINAPDEIVISHTATPGTGEIDITVTGGITPYSYLWSNGSTDEDLTGMDQGTYTIQVTDVVGCTATMEIQLLNDKESVVLAEYLESADSPAGKYYVNTDMPSIRTADHVKALMAAGKVYIIDVRSATDFAAGHIESAVNVAVGDLLSHIESVDLSAYDEVSIVGYTGQVASWGTSLLRLMGYDNVYFMKWGMCAWHEDFAGPWQNNIANMYATLFTTDPTEKGPEGDLPEITTGGSTGEEILEARIDAVLAEGFERTSFGSLPTLLVYFFIQWWSINILDGAGPEAQRFMNIRNPFQAFKAAFLPLILFSLVFLFHSFVIDAGILMVNETPGQIPIINGHTDIEASFIMMYVNAMPGGLSALVFLAFLVGLISYLESFINWGSSFVVVDLFKTYIFKQQSDRFFTRLSYGTMLVIGFSGIAIAWYNTHLLGLQKFIFAMGAGVGPVFILRWFWWRINAWSQLTAMLSSLIFAVGWDLLYKTSIGFQDIVDPGTEALNLSHYAFKLICLTLLVTLTWLLVTFLTRPDDRETLERFVQQVNPGGWWPNRSSKKLVINKQKILLLALYPVISILPFLIIWQFKFGALLPAFGMILAWIILIIFTVRRMDKANS